MANEKIPASALTDTKVDGKPITPPAPKVASVASDLGVAQGEAELQRLAKIAPPSAITSKNAKADAASKASEINAMTQTQPPAKAEAAPVDEADKTAAAIVGSNAKYDSDLKAINDKIDTYVSGSWVMNPEQQQRINDIKIQFQDLIESQKQANSQYEAMVKMSGVSSGRSMYAPELALGEGKAAVDQGMRKVAQINAQMSTAIEQAKAAMKSDDLKALNDSYNRIASLKKSAADEINATHALVREKTEAARADAQQRLNEAKFKFEVEQANLKPINELNKTAQQTLADLVKKYPDAGVTLNDTLATVKEKISNSASYKAELAKAQAETRNIGLTAPTVRDTGRTDQFGNKIQEQWNKQTGQWEAFSPAPNTYEPYYKATDAYSKAVNSAVETLTPRLPSEANKGALREDIARSMEAGEPKTVVAKVKSAAKEALGQTASAQLQASETLSANLPELQKKIDAYVAAGGKMGLVKGTYEQIYGKLKGVSDPKLRALGIEMLASLQNYRRNTTGMAFSVNEMKEYENMFPGLGDTYDFSRAKIGGLLNAANANIDATYSGILGKQNYDQMKAMSNYDNTVTRDDYDRLVASKGKEAADKIIADKKAWIIDLPKAGSGAEAALNTPATDVKKVADAIGQFESGGNYKAVGPVVTSGQYKGDRAVGKYQVMSLNVPSWTKEALGKSMTAEEFKNDPEAQDKTAQYFMQKHLDKYGTVEDVASIWFTGQPASKSSGKKDVIGTSSEDYIKKVVANYNKNA
jgi:hypothetical protein